MATNEGEIKWFAMSAPYRNETKAAQLLEEFNTEYFLPMAYQLVEKRGIRTRKLVPAVSNLIFVHTSEDRLAFIKSKIPVLQYKMGKNDGKNVKIVVRDNDMNSFIKVCTEAIENVKYLRPEEVNLTQGTRIRIIGGALNGVEGLFVKIKGSRSKKLVINIDNFISVATEVEPDMIEVLE